jgi:hypothetical protein
VPALNSLATKAFDASSTYDQQVHFVQVYVIEPHPQDPDPSPYRGTVWEAEYSSKRQPMTYADRVQNARDALPSIQGNQLLLVDELTPGQNDNPLWCTYGPCPNCAFLIRQDGILDTVQTWANAADLESAIDALLR